MDQKLPRQPSGLLQTLDKKKLIALGASALVIGSIVAYGVYKKKKGKKAVNEERERRPIPKLLSLDTLHISDRFLTRNEAEIRS